MASEIEAATERKRRHAMTEAGSDEWFDYARQECGNSQEDRDNATLADAYVARLAADRAEREERAKPIDDDYVTAAAGMDGKTNGNDPRDRRWFVGHENSVFCVDRFHVTNRPELAGEFVAAVEVIIRHRWQLDLLRALKGGA